MAAFGLGHPCLMISNPLRVHNFLDNLVLVSSPLRVHNFLDKLGLVSSPLRVHNFLSCIGCRGVKNRVLMWNEMHRVTLNVYR